MLRRRNNSQTLETGHHQHLKAAFRSRINANRKKSRRLLGHRISTIPKTCSSQQRMLSPKTLSKTTQRCSCPLGIHSLEHPPEDRFSCPFFQKPVHSHSLILNTDTRWRIRSGAASLPSPCPHPVLHCWLEMRKRCSVSSSDYQGLNLKVMPSCCVSSNSCL